MLSSVTFSVAVSLALAVTMVIFTTSRATDWMIVFSRSAPYSEAAIASTEWTNSITLVPLTPVVEVELRQSYISFTSIK